MAFRHLAENEHWAAENGIIVMQRVWVHTKTIIKFFLLYKLLNFTEKKNIGEYLNNAI